MKTIVSIQFVGCLVVVATGCGLAPQPTEQSQNVQTSRLAGALSAKGLQPQLPPGGNLDQGASLGECQDRGPPVHI